MNDFDPIKKPSLWAALRHGVGGIVCDVLFALAIVVTIVCAFYALDYAITNHPVAIVVASLAIVVVFAVIWRALGWYEIEEQRLFDEQMKNEEPKP